MEAEYVTTPFGRRPMTLAMLVAQRRARHDEPVRSVDKWKIYRALCEAKPRLGITDRALAVLNALLSFYPKNELSDDANLIVFPSNAQLSLRAHGMAEQTIRRHLAGLVEAGLIVRRDSPNGKRYARRTRAGDLHEAYGFSLAPLLSRADEIEHLAAAVVTERLHAQALRERISLLRRDIAKLIETAITEAIAGDWDAIHCGFRYLIDSLPRSPSATELEHLHHKLDLLHLEIVNRLEKHAKTKILSANHYQNERHIQNSDSESIIESETAQPEACAELSATDIEQRTHPASPAVNKPVAENTKHSLPVDVSPQNAGGGGTALKSFPLDLIIRACPEIAAYSPNGRINNWRDLTSASIVVGSMLEISSGTHQEACAAMGVENTATVIACILQRTSQIKSAGAYLRDLTRRTQKGEFALGPMLMSLLRANTVSNTRSQPRPSVLGNSAAS